MVRTCAGGTLCRVLPVLLDAQRVQEAQRAVQEGRILPREVSLLAVAITPAAAPWASRRPRRSFLWPYGGKFKTAGPGGATVIDVANKYVNMVFHSDINGKDSHGGRAMWLISNLCLSNGIAKACYERSASSALRSPS